MAVLTVRKSQLSHRESINQSINHKLRCYPEYFFFDSFHFILHLSHVFSSSIDDHFLILSNFRIFFTLFHFLSWLVLRSFFASLNARKAKAANQPINRKIMRSTAAPKCFIPGQFFKYKYLEADEEDLPLLFLDLTLLTLSLMVQEGTRIMNSSAATF